MSKKNKSRAVAAPSPTQLRERIKVALAEKRTQRALELVKELHKQEDSPETRQMLAKVYLERARQQRQGGQIKEAVTVLENALKLDYDEPAFMADLSQEFARLGRLDLAQALAAKTSNPQLTVKLAQNAVDAAMERQHQGLYTLPENLRPDMALILSAFEHLSAGRDDQVTAALQQIGLQSPFLDWKVLLRGLQAYYNDDSQRAIENWQRLDSGRLPARLAAPLRMAIDPAFRQAQSAAAQQLLEKQANVQSASPLVSALRQLQKALAHPQTMSEPFRLAATCAPVLRQQYPALFTRLANCFYWAVIKHGEPRDMNRFRQTFGAPADDPSFSRMQGLVLEDRMNLGDANDAWRDYEKWIATRPPVWASESAANLNLARALIWARMAEKAAELPSVTPQMAEELKKLKGAPAYLNGVRSKAGDYLRKAIELAPDSLTIQCQLFEWYLEEKDDRAAQAGQSILRAHPDHLPTLLALGGLAIEKTNFVEAIELIERAQKANLLEKKLKRMLSFAHVGRARQHAVDKDFDAARAEFAAAIAISDRKNHTATLCKWAVCEFKARNDARAEELLEQARVNGGPLEIAFFMLAELARFELKGKQRTRFNQQFKEAIKTTSGVDTLQTLEAVLSYFLNNVDYTGQKTLKSAVISRLMKTDLAEFSEPQCVRLGTALTYLQEHKPLLKLAKVCQRRFSTNPHFYVMEVEAHVMQGPEHCRYLFRLEYVLETARQFASELPHDESSDKLRERISAMRGLIGTLGNPFFGGFAGGPFGDDDDDEGIDEDDTIDPDFGEFQEAFSSFFGRKRGGKK